MYDRHVVVGMAALACVLSCSPGVQADIYRQTSNQIIPGTSGIKAGPGVDLEGLDLELAILQKKNLTNAKLVNTNLSNATLYRANLSGANLSGAVVTQADLGAARNFQADQLYSTQNYLDRNLRGVVLGSNDLSGWNFFSVDLTNGSLQGSTLEGAILNNANLSNVSLQFAELQNADLGGAMISHADFRGVTDSGFTADQLYSTASYLMKELPGVKLWENDLVGWNFAGQNLRGANFRSSNLTDADLFGADIGGSILTNVTSFGFTEEQLYTTQSYRNRDLRGVNLSENSVIRWDFRDQDLEGANFFRTDMFKASLEGANIVGVTLGLGLNKEQVYSTRSYQKRDLRGVFLVTVI